MEQISNLGNSSTHKSHLPFFPSKSKRQSWARRKPDFLLQFSYILEIFSSFNHKWWIHPAQSLQTVHGWPLKAQWRPGILAILLSLYPLFSIYCLLTISFFLSLSFSFFLFFFFFFSFLNFIPMVDIRFLLFCNFTTAKLFNDCSKRAVYFWGYILCLQGVW